MKRRLVVLLLAAAAIAATVAGPAIAGHLATGVKSYTGCLVSKDGVIIRIKEGNLPSSPCSGGQVEVHFGGGDITRISEGTGIDVLGAGDNGDVVVAVHPAYRLPQGCATGKIAKWDGDTWECADDATTTYTAGTGVDIDGSTISIEPPYRLPAAGQGDSIVKGSGSTWITERFTRAGEGCTGGQFVTGTSSSGGVSCATPPAGSGNAWVQASGTPGIVPDDYAYHTFAELNPGAGTWLITAKAVLGSQQNVDQFRSVSCDLRVDGTSYDSTSIAYDVLNDERRLPVHLTTVASVTTGFSLRCSASEGADGIAIDEIKLIGVKL